MAFRNKDLSTKKSWLERAKVDIPRVLKGFWKRRIKVADPNFNKEGFKSFIKSTYEASGKTWSNEIENQFNDIIQEKNDFNKFKEFFGDWFTIESAMVVDRNHLEQPPEKTVTTISDDDLMQLTEYINETNISAVIAMGNINGQFRSVLSTNISSSVPFQIHSVMKMFTGTLAIKMIEKNIIPEDELNKPLSKAFAGNFLKSLPEKFKQDYAEHLSNVTLHQLMTHKSGLGDYYESENKSIGYQNPFSYQKAITEAMKDPNIKQPSINQIEDLLIYADKTNSAIGNWRYSNLGITLVGLAIEYAYKLYKKQNPNDEVNPDFESILHSYILKEADINPKNFTKDIPHNGRFNTNEGADPCAPFIIGGPAGYYWTTAEDLARFGAFLYNQYMQNERFHQLIDAYGEEFFHAGTFSHTGTLVNASSAFLSISTKGNIIAILCDNSDENANSLEARIKRNIFSDPIEAFPKAAVTAKISSSLFSPLSNSVYHNKKDDPMKKSNYQIESNSALNKKDKSTEEKNKAGINNNPLTKSR